MVTKRGKRKEPLIKCYLELAWLHFGKRQYEQLVIEAKKGWDGGQRVAVFYILFAVLTIRIAVSENENAISSTKMCDWQRVLRRSELIGCPTASILSFARKSVGKTQHHVTQASGGSSTCVRNMQSASRKCRGRVAAVEFAARHSHVKLVHSHVLRCFNEFLSKRGTGHCLLKFVSHSPGETPTSGNTCRTLWEITWKKNSVFVWRSQSRER